MTAKGPKAPSSKRKAKSGTDDEQSFMPDFVEDASQDVCLRFRGPQQMSKTMDLFGTVYRRIAIPNIGSLLRKHPGKGKVIMLDTETTGLYSEHDEILSLAIVDAKDGTRLYYELMRPLHRTSWNAASEINGIYYRDVKDEPTFQERREDVQRIISDAEVILGYNVRFDLEFLIQNDIELPRNVLIGDVMLDYATFKGETVGRCRSWKRASLDDAAWRCGFRKHKVHDAHSDCLAALCVYWYMSLSLKHIFGETDPEPPLSVLDRSNVRRSKKKKAKRIDDPGDSSEFGLRPYHSRFSMMEKAFVYYARKMVACEEEYEPPGVPLVCIDCFMPSLKMAVEYDGRVFHQGPVKSLWEESTNNWCHTNGIRLIRIRDVSCPEIHAPDAWMTVQYDSDDYPDSAESAFGKVLGTIAEEIGVSPPSVDIRRDKTEILDVCRKAKARWDEHEAELKRFKEEAGYYVQRNAPLYGQDPG